MLSGIEIFNFFVSDHLKSRARGSKKSDIKGNIVRNNICYPNDISEFVFDRDEENSDQPDFETSSDFEDEIDDDIDSNTDLC